MLTTATRAEVYFGDTAFRAGPLTEMELGQQYTILMHRLYGDRVKSNQYCDPARFRAMLDRPERIISFVILDGQLVSTAEALLVPSEPDWNVLFGNIITRGGFERQGLGALAHETVEQEAKKRWGHDRQLFLALTNNPKKGNAGFYLERGWQATDTTLYCKIHTP